MKKRILSLHYQVQGEWRHRLGYWSDFASSGAKTFKKGKRMLKKLEKEYAGKYRFRLIEDRVKIVA